MQACLYISGLDIISFWLGKQKKPMYLICNFTQVTIQLPLKVRQSLRLGPELMQFFGMEFISIS